MRTALLALILIVATLTAGCMENISAQLASVRGDEHVPEDFTLEASDVLGPGYARALDIPVEEGAVAIRVSALLEASLDGRDAPLTPAQLTVSLVDPSGSTAAARTLDPRTPKATFEVTEFPGFGTWKIRLEGDGLGGNGEGAAYTLTTSVTY